MVKNAINYPSRKRKRNKMSIVLKKLWQKKKANICSIEPSSSRLEADKDLIAFMHNYCIAQSEQVAEGIIQTRSNSKQISVAVEENPWKPNNEDNNHINTFILNKAVQTDDPWDSNNEYDSIVRHTLYTEPAEVECNSVLNGNRIVEIDYLLRKILKIQYYHTKHCTFALLEPIHEKQCGLFSEITLQCSFCEKQFTVETHRNESTPKHAEVVNTAFVWGTLSSGSSYGQTKDLLSLLDIPPPSYRKFRKIEEAIGDNWKDTLWESMAQAGKEEREFAIQNKNICKDGIPWVSVHCDGAWSKRSYGHSYNALSGCAVVIGKETGKVLYVGVRNKYCCICARAANLKKIPEQHTCYKNWNTSSTAMEADIIVEAFKKSVEMHGLKYLEMIGDGDSSVYCKVRKEVSYGNQVQKIECINHLVKNYGKTLHKLKANKNIPSQARRILTVERIKKLQNFVMFTAKVNEDPDVLKTDISNSPNHIYGDHSNCSSRYCNIVGYQNMKLKNEFVSSGLAYYIKDVLQSILPKAHKLILYENNNKAESFMALLAKCNNGKRLNLIQRQSFEVRCFLAALKCNQGLEWQVESFRNLTGSDAGEILQKRIIEHERINQQRVSTKRRKNKLEYAGSDYGPNADQALLSEIEFLFEYTRILNSLQIW